MGGSPSKSSCLVLGLPKSGKTALCESLTLGPSASCPRYQATVGYRLYESPTIRFIELGGTVHKHWKSLFKGIHDEKWPLKSIILCIGDPDGVSASKALLLWMYAYLRRTHTIRMVIIVTCNMSGAIKVSQGLQELFQGRVYLVNLRYPRNPLQGDPTVDVSPIWKLFSEKKG